jgi:GT2 family glycosyltransferase
VSETIQRLPASIGQAALDEPSALLRRPLVSVIIPVWNRCDDLKDTLEHLQQQTYAPYEVLVIDDASTEPIEAMVREHYPAVRFFRQAQNGGAGVARNVGLREARGELVLFLDSDTVPEEQALEKYVQKFLAEPDLGIASGLQYDAQTGKPWWWWTQHGYAEEQYLRVEFETAFKFAEGAAAARKEAVLAVGGYPEELFMAGEGRDLAARLTDAGYRVIYWPEVTFLHKPAQRLKANNWYRSEARRLYFEFRNEFWYTVKYFPVPLLLVKTTLNLGRNLRRAMQGHALREFFRAYRDGVRGLPAALKQRKVLKPATIYKITSEKYKKLLGPLVPGKKEALAEAAARARTS